jgi:hypothetical protein
MGTNGELIARVAPLYARYGLGEVHGWRKLFDLIAAGLKECARVLRPDGRLLVKCADYVESGRRRFVHHHVVATCLDLGLAQIDELVHVRAHRAPAGDEPGRHAPGPGDHAATALVPLRLRRLRWRGKPPVLDLHPGGCHGGAMAMQIPVAERDLHDLGEARPDTWTPEELAAARGGFGGAPVSEMAVPPPGRPLVSTSPPDPAIATSSSSSSLPPTPMPAPTAVKICTQCRRPAKFGRATCGRPECVEGNRKARQRDWFAARKARNSLEEVPMSIHQADAVPAAQNGARHPENDHAAAGTDLLATLAAILTSLPEGWRLEASAGGVTLAYPARTE